LPIRRPPAPPPDLAAALVLVGASLLVHLPAIVLGRIPMQDDVKVFYFPLLVATSEALHRGTLPFWTPSMFGGYPLFADGEAGMLYPPQLLLLSWLSPEATLVWLHVIHTSLSALFTYLLLRTLGTRPVGAVVGGLVYALSAYTAGQMVHSNVTHAIAWLPLQLALVERAFRAQGFQRARLVLMAGAAVGIQGLALHIHFTLLSALTITCFAAYRTIVGARPNFHRSFSSLCQASFRGVRRVAVGVAIVAGVGATGVGLAAAQLVPLAELGRQTYRGAGLEAPVFTSANSVSLPNLVSLLLPHVFDTPSWGYWAPWVKWETTLYVGIAPLLLALIGLCSRSGPYRPFFAGLAVFALLGAFGDQAPLPVWDTLHTLSPFSVLRSPGRFILLFALAMAVLSGYGVDRLCHLSRPHPRWAGLVSASAAAVVAGAWMALPQLDTVVRTSPVVAAWAQGIQALPGAPSEVDGAPLTAVRVLAFLGDSLRSSQPTWAATLLMLTLVVISIRLIHPRARAVASTLMAGLVLTDLVVLVYSFHPYGSVADLRPKLPPVLLQHASAPFRVYTPPTARDKRTQVEPNRLLAAGLEEANGYSSLAPDRHTEYVNAVEYAGNDLLDLWNARFVVQRVRTNLLPSYGGTSFHPEHPLFSGRRGSPGAGGTMLPDGGDALADEVHLVATLWDAASVPQGAIAAAIKLTTSSGDERTLLMHVGTDVSDARLERPSLGIDFQHRSAEIAHRYQRSDPGQARYAQQLYYARLRLPAPMTVHSLEFLNLLPSGGMEVFGIGLWNRQTAEITQVRDPAKLRLMHADDEIRVFENTGVMPRAFLVPSVRIVPPGRDALPMMVDGPFDPRRTAVVECQTPESRCGLPTGLFEADSSGVAMYSGTATFKAYEDHWSVIQTASDREALLVISDSFLPGWEAQVDGAPATILQTNSLFRGVAVPAGTHNVTFAYSPLSVPLGGAVTLASSGFLLVCWLAYALAWAMGKRRAMVPSPSVARTRNATAPASD
jgi:hypothetical protein